MKYFILILFLLIYCNKSIVNDNSFSPISQIGKNEWIVIKKINDTNELVKVIYTEKYGSTNIIYGTILFFNSNLNQYKLVSKDSDYIIEKANMNNLQTEIVKNGN
jgi:hypothetical protein